MISVIITIFSFVWVCFVGAKSSANVAGRRTQFISVPHSVGSKYELTVHSYGPQDAPVSVYIQASAHADELPGMLVLHHLMNDLDVLQREGLIHQKITLVPYANPIGLAQDLLGSHIGRFSLSSGTNFNREYEDYSAKIESLIEDGSLMLSMDDAAQNVAMIRQAMKNEIRKTLDDDTLSSESVLKYNILKLACDADVVLDLHCDTNALVHMYTHTHLWPALRDLAGDIDAQCTLLAEDSGGTCLDEACSNVWYHVSRRYPQYPVPMACESATLELRGESDVNDDLAKKDALAIRTFLHRRGYLSLQDGRPVPTARPPPREATPLNGVDFLGSATTGLLIMKKEIGDVVEHGDTVAEVIRIDDPDAARVPIKARSKGLLFCMAHPSRRLVGPGRGTVAKIAGEESLSWRRGNLLTAR